MLCSLIFIGVHQMSLGNLRMHFGGFGSSPSPIIAPLFDPGAPDLSVSLEGQIRDINPHLHSIPGVDSIEVQRITPSDTGWVPAGSIPNSVYYGLVQVLGMSSMWQRGYTMGNTLPSIETKEF